MKMDEFFYRHPVFTSEELSDYLKTTRPVRPRTQESILAHYQKAGRLVKLRRGLYAAIPTGANAETYPVNPYLLAAKLTKDAVLSYHSALEFHGKAYSSREFFTYLARRPLRPLAFRNHRFRGVRYPRNLLRLGKEDYGVITRDCSGLDIRVTSLERTLVDVLDKPSLSGSWEEIFRSLELVEYYQLEQVVEYALLLGNATTAAKVGFFMDQRRDAMMSNDADLKMLLELRPRQPHYLERSKRESGILVAKWNLVVPEGILRKDWASVSGL